ncbi:MAG TPA: FAD-dependent oxidoreductase, partial [Pseudomonadales bacterium]|nr:FAD-dependent oxidoreductase [Pseudomonadales bacterium]
MQTYPIAKHLVLVGGGHSHVIVLRMLGMRRVPGLAITLISPDVETAYSGMLPGVVAGYYSEDDIHIDLARLARFAGARLIRARVTGIDPVAQRVRCEGRPELPYDALSIDTGITPALDDIAGANAGIAVKPINDFLEKFEAFRARVAAGKVASAGFVGAGAGGVELCLAVAGRLSKADAAVAIHLFSDKSTILPGYPQSVGERFARHLAGRGVTVHSHFTATRYRDGMLSSAQGENCHLDEVFFVTRAAAPAWLGETGLSLDENGFIKVRGTLQAMTFDNVFAAGDIASVVDFPRPRAGVFAVRQGRPLYRNLLAVLHGRSAKPFRPQREFLSLITTGSRYAVASRNGFSVEGQWVWRWKDWIDRRFMHRFNRLPAMKTEPMTGLLAEFDEQMRCGGCGSKVSADILDEVLRELGAGGDQRDDAAVIEVPP